jgi:hypothetical protein
VVGLVLALNGDMYFGVYAGGLYVIASIYGWKLIELELIVHSQ